MMKSPAPKQVLSLTAILLALFTVSGFARGQASLLLDNYPESYVVRDGDTLWNIASQFLEDPFRWDDIWLRDRFLDDPDSIYPGDTVRVESVNGTLRLVTRRGDLPAERVSPRMRVSALSSTIPEVSLEDIANVIIRNRIVSEELYDTAPYIVSTLNRNLIISTGDEIFARGNWPSGARSFEIYSEVARHNDPDTDELLGIELLTKGMATIAVDEGDDVRKMIVNSSNREIQAGDRLLVRESGSIGSTIFPAQPKSPVMGRIIAFGNGETLASQMGTVLVNLGSEDGLEIGTTLALQKPGSRVVDDTGRDRKPFGDQITAFVTNEKLQLPNREFGTLMIYRTFEKLSFALILSITEPAQINDLVTNP